MWKFFIIFLSLLINVIFCGCINYNVRNDFEEKSSEYNSVLSESTLSTDKRIIKSNDEKYGLLDENANIIIEPVYQNAKTYDNIVVFTAENNTKIIINYSGEKVGEYDRIEEKFICNDLFFIASNIDGTRAELNPIDDESIDIIEVENATCYVLNAFGKSILEEPYDDIAIGLEADENIHIYAVRDGNRYEYVKDKNSFELIEKNLHGETGFENYGYKEVVYFWNICRTGHGLIDNENNVVFAPIYRRIRVPFEDRVLLYTGDIVAGEGVCSIVTLKGEKLAQFGNIEYIFFDNDNYVGIAFANETACNFNSDDAITYGWYFIDKNGKIISDLFLSYPDFQNETGQYLPESTVKVVSKDGAEITISIKDYICNQ